MLRYTASVEGGPDIQEWYLRVTNERVNANFFDLGKHPKLQWLMLCSASPGIGKQFHAWIPQIKAGVAKLKDKAMPKDIREYFKKIYPGLSAGDLKELTTAFCEQHKRKIYLANKFPELKFDEVELLSELVTVSVTEFAPIFAHVKAV